MEVLTQQEVENIEAKKAELLHAEQAIERAARNAFEEAGAQYKHIRDRKLYYFHRESGCTWEDYCQERWEMTPQRIGQLISGYEIVNELKPENLVVDESETNGFYLPTSERQVRPLSKLQPNDRALVWQRVIENSNGHVTAKMVEAEVQRFEASKEKNWITLKEWEEGERWHGGQSKTTMNEVNENIEWAAMSWNPVTGCLHNCNYCYAHDIANRFYPQKFQPSFLPERLNQPVNTKIPKPRWTGDTGNNNVFTCSMADLFGKWVPQEWIEAVLSSIQDNPQWTFLLLSKFPVRMTKFTYPKNVWLGTTVDKQCTVEQAEKAFARIKQSGFDGICWLSCEPMLEKLTFSNLEMFDWVVMGGASRSTKTPEHRPPFEDIVHLYNQARQSDCLIYQKTNLIPGMNDDQRLREYPS